MTAGFGKPMRTAGFLLLVSMFFVALWLFVSKTKSASSGAQQPSIPEAALNRAKDTNYIQRLAAMAREQSRQSMDVVKTQNMLTQCVLRVRATLPKNADAAALQAALEKDEAWVKLAAQEKQQRDEAARLQAEAISTVRQRMQAEAAMQKKQADLQAQKSPRATTR